MVKLRLYAALPRRTLHCKVISVESAQLVARLLGELATARAAIGASYHRLWRPAERSLRETGGFDELADRCTDPEAYPPPGEQPPRDAT